MNNFKIYYLNIRIYACICSALFISIIVSEKIQSVHSDYSFYARYFTYCHHQFFVVIYYSFERLLDSACKGESRYKLYWKFFSIQVKVEPSDYVSLNKGDIIYGRHVFAFFSFHLQLLWKYDTTNSQKYICMCIIHMKQFKAINNKYYFKTVLHSIKFITAFKRRLVFMQTRKNAE